MDNIYKILLKGKISEIIETIRKIRTEAICVKINDYEYILVNYGDNNE